LSGFTANFQKISFVDRGITCSTALSPSLEYPFAGKFGRSKMWSYSGIYGSFARFFTYKTLAQFKKNEELKDIQISVVGGLVHPDHVIEAILLGADTVQFASGIMFKGLNLFTASIRKLKSFMQKHGFKTIGEFRGLSLQYIADNPSEIVEYQMTNELPQNQSSLQQAMVKKTSLCKTCNKCTNASCIALRQQSKGNVEIAAELCSGCGWCQVVCHSNKG
jgi:dihydropyrimidine dehydrogenase (NAD+) subunit PreA